MRVEGWESLLYEHVRDADRPFAWGTHDCALWCADWVRKATGEDFTTAWKGRYANESEAFRLMIERGFADAEAIADEHLQPIAVPLARRGDMLAHPDPARTGTLGICDGRHAVFLTTEGVTRVETRLCPRAWKVG